MRKDAIKWGILKHRCNICICIASEAASYTRYLKRELRMRLRIGYEFIN